MQVFVPKMKIEGNSRPHWWALLQPFLVVFVWPQPSILHEHNVHLFQTNGLEAAEKKQLKQKVNFKRQRYNLFVSLTTSKYKPSPVLGPLLLKWPQTFEPDSVKKQEKNGLKNYLVRIFRYPFMWLHKEMKLFVQKYLPK